ncbi:MAG: DUF805 domain-containing protein [Burkholderiaceae bacterium]|nr:MAG: DUF805 domain-containing protein [Burkholderiaceae bacterium]
MSTSPATPSFLSSLFNPKTRLSRGGFLLRTILIWCGIYAGVILTAPLPLELSVLLVNVPGLVLLCCACIQRLHDRNYSAWYLLLALIPVLGALWLIWQLVFRAGIADDNRWGKNPLRQEGDYLVVS